MRVIVLLALLPGILMARAVGAGHAHCGHSHAGHQHRPHWHWNAAPCLPGEPHDHGDADHDSDAVYLADETATVASSPFKLHVDYGFDLAVTPHQPGLETGSSSPLPKAFWPPGAGPPDWPLFIQHLALLL